MKNLLLISFGLFLTIMVISCNQPENSDNKNAKDSLQAIPNADTDKMVSENKPVKSGKKYAIKSGMVSYKMKMSIMEQKMTMYFDDFGAKEASEIIAEVMGQKVHSRTVNKDGYIYNIDLNNKTGIKMKLSSMPMGGNIDFSSLDIDQMNEMKIKKEEKTEMFLGKECDIYSIDNTQLKGTFHVWQNLMLKTKASASGMTISTEATEINENTDVPAEKFDIPADIKIVEK